MAVPFRFPPDDYKGSLVRDMTRRKYAQEDIVNLAELSDEDPNPVLRISRDGTVLYSNNAGALLLKAWGCYSGRSLSSQWRQFLSDAFKSESPQQSEVECNGRMLALTLAPVVDFHYLNIYAFDVTEYKCIEQALRESEQRFRNIFEHSNDAIFIVDAPGDRIVEVNPKACQLLEYSREELRQIPVSAIHRDEMPRLLSFAQAVQTQNSGRNDELSCLTKSGKCIPVELSASITEFEGRSLLLVIARDLTERKHAEEALTKALREVEQLKDRLQVENIYLRDEIKIEHNIDEIIGGSEALKSVLRKVEQVSSTDATVMILGETGTGKELLARAIHHSSTRRDRPLVKVNCAALPKNLIESELFGHEKGAFTGAIARKIGRFELANGGTIFLDEVGDLPLELQARLLRVLQEGEFERLGNPHSIKVDVRVIAATNRHLEKTVKTGGFREDLYYRLNVFPIHSPPLRDRKEDIPFLVDHFIKKYSAKMGKNIETVPQRMMQALKAYDWPGNVRELENIVERAMILTSGTALELDEQFHLCQGAQEPDEAPHTLRDLELSLIRKALEESNWVIEGKRGAATRLDIPPSTLRERMQKNGIKRPL